MKKLLVCGAAAVAIVGLAPAVAQTAQPTAQAQSSPRATKATKVHTRAEVQAKVAQQFARLDANSDGFVTQAEAQAASDALHARSLKRMGERQTGRGLFERLDTNRDGVVTRAEAAAARQARSEQSGAQQGRGPANLDLIFTRLDTNGDGAISRAEAEAARAQFMAQRRQHADGGKRGMRGHRGGMIGGRMFAMADANNDGRLSLQEAQTAALRHFDMADANRDGQITPDERRQMRQRMINERRPG